MLGALGPRLANVALRAISLGSKFVLVLVLARLLQPAEVGLYGLFVATIAFSTLLIGGDYYTYAQRELVSVERNRWSFVIQHQALATGLLYLSMLPLQLLIFSFGLLPTNLLPWFLTLLVLEHLAQEINRLLVAMGRPVAATWILFIRMGAWVWPLLMVMWTLPETRTLETVIFFFILGVSAAVLVGTIFTWHHVEYWQRWPIDIEWIKRGFRVGFLFLVATLCFKALTTADRYVFEHLAGPDLLGTYVLYIGLAMVVAQFVEPAVISFLYPRIVGAYRKGDMDAYRRLMKELAWSSIVLSIGIAVAIAISAPYVLRWVGRSIYLEHLHLLWLLLGVAVVYVAGLVPHYGLYARGADRAITAAHISALIVFFSTVALLGPLAPIEATAYALMAAFTSTAAIKTIRYRAITLRTKDSGYAPKKADSILEIRSADNNTLATRP